MRIRVVVGALTALVASSVLAFVFAPIALGGSLPSLIAYKLGDYGGSDGIFLLGPGEKTGKPIFGETKGAVYLGSPAWSPNGDVLAFEHDGNQLMFANRAGHLIFTVSIPQGQTTGSGGIAWSPDGKEIAYLCYEGHLTSYAFAPINIAIPGGTANLPNLCIYNVVTGVNRVAAESSLADSITNGEISWARDGSMIATDTETDILSSSTELCVDNHVETSITATPTGPPCNVPSISIVDVGSGSIAPIGKPFFTQPAFSTKGSEIAFEDGSGGAAHSKLETMSASGGDVRVVTDLGSTILANPAWSPNDKEIAFAGVNPNGDGSVGLYEIDADGKGRKPATTFSIYATQWLSHPAWVQPLSLCTVPKLKGLALASAKRQIQLAGCAVGSIGGPKSKPSTRKVVSQSPGPGRNVQAGTKVNVKVR